MRKDTIKEINILIKILNDTQKDLIYIKRRLKHLIEWDKK